MKPIYLDYNATTPVDREVVEAMMPYLDELFGNPSSSHWYGIQTRNAVENARRQVAGLLNCRTDEVVFTSGGTESNNFAIKGAAFANKDKGNHIITSVIEHPAVTEVCKFLEKKGFIVTYLPVDEYGMVDVNDVEKAILPETILITIMHANNEVGTIQPIGEISELARKRGIVFHTDAAQSVGKINTDVGELGVDLMSVAGHKLYAPKGIGALFLRHGISIEKFVHGANHEGNKRAGTENVLEIVGLGKACELAKKELSDRNRHMREMRDRLWDGLKRNLKDLKLNGHPEKRLPNTLNLSFQDIEANKMISEMENLAVSAGAACHSETINISHVLTAMNVPVNYAVGTLRFSTGKMTRKDEIDEAVEIVTDVVRRLKRLKDTT